MYTGSFYAKVPAVLFGNTVSGLAFDFCTLFLTKIPSTVKATNQFCIWICRKFLSKKFEIYAHFTSFFIDLGALLWARPFTIDHWDRPSYPASQSEAMCIEFNIGIMSLPWEFIDNIDWILWYYNYVVVYCGFGIRVSVIFKSWITVGCHSSVIWKFCHDSFCSSIIWNLLI